MSSIIFLVAAYAVVSIGLALYLLALRRQRSELARELATTPADRPGPGQPGE